MSTEMMELNNGSRENAAAIATTMNSVQSLWAEGMMGICAVSDLVDRCRNPGHRIADSEIRKLKGLSLLQPDGRVHDSVRNIVLSAIKGSGLDMQLGTPVKGLRSAADAVNAMMDNVIGIRTAITQALSTKAVSEQDVILFAQNTPGKKVGSALWDEFKARRDAPKAYQGYSFIDFIKEVVAEAKAKH